MGARWAVAGVWAVYPRRRSSLAIHAMAGCPSGSPASSLATLAARFARSERSPRKWLPQHSIKPWKNEHHG